MLSGIVNSTSNISSRGIINSTSKISGRGNGSRIAKIVDERYMDYEIFTITTVPNGALSDTLGDTRTVGYFPTREEANAAVLDNSMDMQEGRYMYAVVERSLPGVYNYQCEEQWYEWGHDQESGQDSYAPIEKPEKFRRVVGWGLG